MKSEFFDSKIPNGKIIMPNTGDKKGFKMTPFEGQRYHDNFNYIK